MNALIIVDVQNDFLPGGALAVPEGDRVVAVINRLQPQFELVVATQDWHPAGHGSFAASHPGNRPGEVVGLDGLEQILWPTHCVQNTPGAAFAPVSIKRAGAMLFKKEPIRRSIAIAASTITATASPPASATTCASTASPMST